jgi:CRISPR-associated protein Csm2
MNDQIEKIPEKVKYPEIKIKTEWIRNEISDDAIEWAKSFGEYLSRTTNQKALTTSQLRRFFGELKRIDSDFKKNQADLLMLKPMLAYAVGRDKDDSGRSRTHIKEFEEEMSKGITSIRISDKENGEKDFRNFVKIFEAIVAYHKYYGGK